MTYHVTLEDLADQDAVVARLEARVAELSEELRTAARHLASHRALQGRMVIAYNAQAARPLVEP